MIDVLCIGAHPDDVELAMGGTVVAMVRDGLRVALCDLTDGEPTPAGSREVRLREAAEAAEVLGVALRRTLPFPNRNLADTPEARRALAEVIRELQPRILFGPAPHDWHPDHVAASALVLAARFHAKWVKTDMSGAPHYPAHLYQYPAVHARAPVKAAFIVDVSDTAEDKMRALRCYRSQFVANSANQHILGRVEQCGAYFGGLIYTRCGEPFLSVEEIGLRSLKSLV
jgi:N-acetylglucosamine malate deacetylase 1